MASVDEPWKRFISIFIPKLVPSQLHLLRPLSTFPSFLLCRSDPPAPPPTTTTTTVSVFLLALLRHPALFSSLCCGFLLRPLAELFSPHCLKSPPLKKEVALMDTANVVKYVQFYFSSHTACCYTILHIRILTQVMQSASMNGFYDEKHNSCGLFCFSFTPQIWNL